MVPTNVNMKKNTLLPPPELITTASLSGGLAIIFSLTSVVLSILAIVYRFNCSVAVSSTNGADFFLVTLIRTYILNDECTQSLQIEGLTKANSVFILAIIILCLAFINFLTAVSVITVVNHHKPVRNIDIFIYIYLASSIALFVADVTFSVHFGIDHETLKYELASTEGGLEANYQTDIVRLGALLLMSVCLKGFIGHIINIVLLVTLAVYVIRYQRTLNDNDHSIHKLGAINAFDATKNGDEPWSPQRNETFMNYSRGTSINGLSSNDEMRHLPMRENLILTDIPNSQKRIDDPWAPHSNRNEMLMGYPRGGQTNHAFNGDGPQRASKENSISDRPSDRSNSWLHNTGMGVRPFSYLEDPKRPMPVKTPTTPSAEPQWRRDAWPPAPPVPDPDYSPQPRRLKSALKPNYM